MAACLADDMGLGKTIQLPGLTCKAILKSSKELKRRRGGCWWPHLRASLNWKSGEAPAPPRADVLEHYGPEAARHGRRPWPKALRASTLVLTAATALLQRDSELLACVDWQGMVIDEGPGDQEPLPPSNPWQPGQLG